MPRCTRLAAELVRTLDTSRRTGVLSHLLRAAIAMILCAGVIEPQFVPPASTESFALEYKVKAAFLLNFTKFIEWSGSESMPAFSICLVGDDPFGPVLDKMVQGESVGGRKIIVQRTSRDAAKGCQIAYIAKSERNPKEILSGLAPNVLTVGEGESFIRDGGVLAFVIDKGRVRFDISLAAARNEQLTVSSRLLTVARSVER